MVNIEIFKKPKIPYIFKETLAISVTCSKSGREDEEISKEKESIEILKIPDLINNIEEYQKKTKKT